MKKNEQIRLIGFNEFFCIIAKRKMIMIIITLISVLISGFISFFMMSPVYESQASVIVDKRGDGSTQNVQYNDVMMYQNLVKTYANIALSDKIYSEAAEKLNNTISADELAKSTTIEPIQDTQMLTVTVHGTSPTKTLDSIKSITGSFIEVANSVYPAGDIRIVNQGKLPKAPIKPNKKFNIIVGFLIGILISIGLIFLLDYFDDTVESIEDIKRNFDLPILGTIQMEEKS
ncbi:YveK family protein [Clostridium pasteurianum]|uniref:Capsular polysaccharide biosynthesis protein n=1 Tax=Clostridium pasteurianum BC1 TaxID=86416 RepID=R4K5Q0_CLOPA|nr:Wzz/FepE/Etk N-terminal domain-containing protein [Clostridium pasteurianum]AGK95869.1 capsular polysaccharide biosynthesis protein [Clostridium pasteurianum BC1]